MRHSKDVSATVLLGEGVVTVRSGLRSGCVVANVLGAEFDEDGRVVRLWLDRLVHESWQERIGQWRCWGVFTSVLELDECKPAGSGRRINDIRCDGGSGSEVSDAG